MLKSHEHLQTITISLISHTLAEQRGEWGVQKTIKPYDTATLGLNDLTKSIHGRNIQVCWPMPLTIIVKSLKKQHYCGLEPAWTMLKDLFSTSHQLPQRHIEKSTFLYKATENVNNIGAYGHLNENAPHRLICLNTCSLVCITALERL